MKRIKTITAGRLVSSVCYTASTIQDGPYERRAKHQMSAAAQERINLRRSWQKLELLLAANFSFRDIHVVFTYDDEHLPENRAASIKKIKILISQLRNYRRARDQPLRYIYVTEELSDQDQRIHHHMILNGTGSDIEILRSLWPRGQVNLEPLDIWDGYEALAKYLTKEPREVGRAESGTRSWTPSKGLNKPDVKSEVVKDHVTITSPPGAVILDRREERNEYGEYTYLKYMLPERRGGEKKSRPPRKRKTEQGRASCSVWKPPVTND